MNPTFADFLTPAGVVVAAGVVTTLIEILKAVFTGLAERVSGAALAFVLTAILYVLTALAVGVPTPDAALAIFLAWLACATSAIGIKSAVVHARESMTGGGQG